MMLKKMQYATLPLPDVTHDHPLDATENKVFEQKNSIFVA